MLELVFPFTSPEVYFFLQGFFKTFWVVLSFSLFLFLFFYPIHLLVSHWQKEIN